MRSHLRSRKRKQLLVYAMAVLTAVGGVGSLTAAAKLDSPISNPASTPPTIVAIGNGGAPPTGTATMPLVIVTSHPQGIGSAMVVLTYAPEVVHVDSVSAGELGSVSAHIDNTTAAGTTTMTAATGSSPGPTGTVLFADVTLQAVGNPGDSSPLDLTVNSLYDGSSGSPQPVSPRVETGSFTIGEPSEQHSVAVFSPGAGAVVNGTVLIAGFTQGNVTRVQVNIDNASWNPAEGTALWRYRWDTRQVSEGTHTISVRAGNTTTWTKPTTISVTVKPKPASGSDDSSGDIPGFAVSTLMLAGASLILWSWRQQRGR